ncbi:MAG: hypothetical protein LBG29_01390 [Synergistaceae bacterium]|jgi:hypothetical protein|nr:hypothetical protein [Synergistaceae bacterium]
MNFSRLNLRPIALLAATALLSLLIRGTLYAGETDLKLPPLKDQPDGFAGLKWGDSADKLADQGLLFGEGSSEQYVVPGDGRTWEGFEIDEMKFSFKKNQLVMVRLSFAESAKPDSIKEYAMKKYDKPSLENKRDGVTSYVWNDDVFGVILRIRPQSVPELSLMNHELALALSF